MVRRVNAEFSPKNVERGAPMIRAPLPIIPRSRVHPVGDSLGSLAHGRCYREAINSNVFEIAVWINAITIEGSHTGAIDPFSIFITLVLFGDEIGR